MTRVLAFGARVRGRVQGVGFRWATRLEARARHLGGWVRNEADGSVRVHAEGDEVALAGFRDWLRKGPPGARVDVVETIEDEPIEGRSEFDIRRDGSGSGPGATGGGRECSR